MLRPQSFRRLERAVYAGQALPLARLVLGYVRDGAVDATQAFAGHPLEDDFHDLLHTGLAEHWPLASDYLYVVGNAAHNGFYKVGMTRLSPEQRGGAALNNETVIGRFELVQSWAVHDRHALEKRAHRLLAGLPRHKEFFHAHWQQVCQCVDKAFADDCHQLSSAGIQVPGR